VYTLFGQFPICADSTATVVTEDMATDVRIDGLDALQAAFREFPARGKQAQRTLLIASARRVTKELESDILRGAPVRTGRLKKTIRVFVPRVVSKPQLIIQGSAALVPQNAQRGFMSRALRRLPALMGREADAELVRWIKRSQGRAE